MLRLPFEREAANGLLFRAAFRRELLPSMWRFLGREPDREMLRERSCEAERDVMETSKESPVR